MNRDLHYIKLAHMYLSAPIQDYYKGTSIEISKNRSEIAMEVREDFFHAGQAMHGSVYFRLLDDAAYFAVLSEITDVFIVTSSFHIQLYRPVNKGKLTAIGKVISRGKQLFHAEAELFDEKGRLLAKGSGSFAKSKLALEDVESYRT